jgi:hypothetical protein
MSFSAPLYAAAFQVPTYITKESQSHGQPIRKGLSANERVHLWSEAGKGENKP